MSGLWIGASYVLGRDVRTDEPYPHICGLVVDGRMTPGLRVLLEPKNCAACTRRGTEGSRHVQAHNR